jgi:electron transport complex protein RnfD
MPLSRLSSPFLLGVNRITLHMLQLLLALVPAVIAMVYFFGPSVLITMVIAIVVALTTEAVMLKLRNRPLTPFLTDGSAVVTAVLFAIALPPLAPWWLTTIGIMFAIIFSKHLYGGLGYNPFNPAMVAYVLLLISFPLEMTSWLPVNSLNESPLDFYSTFQVIFNGHVANGADAMTGATPLDAMKTQIGLAQLPASILQQPLFNGLAGQGWMSINLWFVLGGLYLINRKVISWHIPVAMITAMGSISLIVWLISPETAASPLFHILSGGTMLGAFFIATDPVSGCTTLKGRLVFGAAVGLLTYIIRVWGGYPDGVAFAVIIINMMVPLIDYYTQPRVYGEVRK